MYASITFNFETREEFEATMRAYSGAKAMVEEAKSDLVPAASTEVDATVDKPKRGRPAKVEPEPEQAEPAPEKSKKAALGDIVGAIRSFVLADKVGNMRKLIPLMPEGKKSLDSLDLEEAQRIALTLGLEVG